MHVELSEGWVTSARVGHGEGIAEDGISFLHAASREESLISIEAIVNACAFLYGSLRLTSDRHA